MPVIKANEFQITKAKSQRKVATDEGVAEIDNF